jgi:hypothetical protein
MNQNSIATVQALPKPHKSLPKLHKYMTIYTAAVLPKLAFPTVQQILFPPNQSTL